ncbi:phosphatidylinositol 4-phosphate 5-kinase type-1 alpha-like, partial [Sitodiplosis mosellana]|uniref:phosphatidylinositol 4-phosphate 5-kinase type-1 alpha-like n=1 Tax=Sitodiplosis mosellana TaxID=263140 RepID=UPI002444D2A8
VNGGLNAADEHVVHSLSCEKYDPKQKLGYRTVSNGNGSEITFKKMHSSHIMDSIQIAILHTVCTSVLKPKEDLLMNDFGNFETILFPPEGSSLTPAHHYDRFRFKDYAPTAFRYFRGIFGIQPDDFVTSLCSAPLREMSINAKSGSLFYLTIDNEFIIKTVQQKEAEFLQKILPGYYMNINQNPRTFLPKFFGLYDFQYNIKNFRIVVMNNLLPSSVEIHQKYDLKGSIIKRKLNAEERAKSSPTYKDLDFIEQHPNGIFLESDTYDALVNAIHRDCRVLESFEIFDYSLLVGVHNLDLAIREKQEKTNRPSHVMPDLSTISHKHHDPLDRLGGIPARNGNGERLLLFIGIIDVLQSYRLKRKLEHAYKSIAHDGDTVSVCRPSFYAQRFQDFMTKTVFKKMPSDNLGNVPQINSSANKKLIKKGAKIDSTKKLKQQLLRSLAINGYADVAEKLISNGLKIEPADNHVSSHLATENGHEELAKDLKSSI